MINSATTGENEFSVLIFPMSCHSGLLHPVCSVTSSGPNLFLVDVLIKIVMYNSKVY